MNLLDNGLPADFINPGGTSPIVLVCEHASRHIPLDMNALGLSDENRSAHFVWDIGAEALARKLSEKLDAVLVVQRYSRLVYDCNRPPENPSAMPEMGETTAIPGNRNISDEEREARIEQFYQRFHKSISEFLDVREGEPVFVTIHSFTPTFKGVAREVELGILHDADTRLADAMLAQEIEGVITRRNEPYGPKDNVTHTINLHGNDRGIANVMIEIRNDLISDGESQEVWAERLAVMLKQATKSLTQSS